MTWQHTNKAKCISPTEKHILKKSNIRHSSPFFASNAGSLAIWCRLWSLDWCLHFGTIWAIGFRIFKWVPYLHLLFVPKCQCQAKCMSYIVISKGWVCFWKLRGDGSSGSDDQSAESSMGESDTESLDSDEPTWQGSIDLTLDRLQSMKHVAGQYHHDESSYSKNGRSKKRIRNAINNPICPCKCRVNIGILMKVCLLFWLLSKSGQDSILWAIQTGKGKKNRWCIEGLVSCVIKHHAFDFNQCSYSKKCQNFFCH